MRYKNIVKNFLLCGVGVETITSCSNNDLRVKDKCDDEKGIEEDFLKMFEENNYSFESFKNFVGGLCPDINNASLSGDPLLVFACKNGSWKVARWLIDMGINVNQKKDMSALHYACEKKNVDFCSLLLSKGAKIEGEELIACRKRHWDCAKFLIKKGATLEGEGGFGRGSTCLNLACSYGNPDFVKFLLSTWTPLESQKVYNAALITSCANEKWRCARILCEKGADVNVRFYTAREGFRFKMEGYTPSGFACHFMYFEALDFFSHCKGVRGDNKSVEGCSSSSNLMCFFDAGCYLRDPECKELAKLAIRFMRRGVSIYALDAFRLIYPVREIPKPELEKLEELYGSEVDE